MRKLKDNLRLHHASGLSRRSIASALNIGYGAVVNYLNRAKSADVSWPLPDGLSDDGLCRLLFRRAPVRPHRFVEPDYVILHQELKHKGVTKQLLWEDYKHVHAEHGYQYSQFCRSRIATIDASNV
jgi:transposase